jgi:hypothetical protein
MVTKAYLDAKLLPSVERVLKEAGPDSLYEALRTACPEASLPPGGNIEVFAQFGGGSISPLFIEYSHDDKASISLNFERGAIVIGESYAYLKTFGLILKEVVDVVGEYLLACCANETGGSVVKARKPLSEVLAAYSGTLRESKSQMRYQGAIATKQPTLLASGNNHNVMGRRSSATAYSRVNGGSHRPSISGWLAYLLGLYLVGSGTFNIIQLVRGGSDTYKAGAETLRQYGLDAGLTPATIVASYVVGAPIFVGSGLMVLGSIARDMKRNRQNSSG